MVLGDVEETITVVDVNDETMEEVIRVSEFLRLQVPFQQSKDANFSRYSSRRTIEHGHYRICGLFVKSSLRTGNQHHQLGGRTRSIWQQASY